MNAACLVGRLTADVEVKTSANGEYASFTLAIEDRFKDKAGKWQVVTDFVPCVAFTHLANYLQQYGKKGGTVEVLGKIKVRTHQQKVYVTVKADHVRVWLMPSRTSADTPEPKRDDDIPF